MHSSLSPPHVSRKFEERARIVNIFRFVGALFDIEYGQVRGGLGGFAASVFVLFDRNSTMPGGMNAVGRHVLGSTRPGSGKPDQEEN